MRVLLDAVEGEFAIGRTEFDAPEVDNEVLIPCSQFIGPVPVGTFVDALITDASEYDLVATLER